MEIKRSTTKDVLLILTGSYDCRITLSKYNLSSF